MADQISAEEGALQRGAQAVADAKSGIDQKCSAVSREIEAIRPYWDGAAALAYTQLMNEWHTKATKLNAILITLEDSLKKTAQDQQATSDEHQQTISGLSGLLG